MPKLLIIAFAVLFVTGCANNVNKAAETLANKEPRRCEVTIQDGVVQVFEGEDCTKIASAAARKLDAAAADQACNISPPEAPDPEGGQVSTAEYESYTRSFQDYAREKSRCSTTVASYQGLRGGQQQGRQTSDDMQFMIAAMQADTQIMSAWISQIPLVGTVTSQYFGYKSQQQLQNTLRTAFENSGPEIGSLHMNQSNDGGAGGPGGEAPGGPGGAGGGGDQILLLGNGNQATPGTGSVISDGRNASIIAPGSNENLLNPLTENNQNTAASENSTANNNPINNAPLVGPEDNDGSGDNSIIPGL